MTDQEIQEYLAEIRKIGLACMDKRETDLAAAKEREAALVEALKTIARNAYNEAKVSNSTLAASVLDAHAPGWRAAP